MQRNTLRIALLGGVLVLGATWTQAQSWQMVGTRAMGMGGAGVATAYGPDAQYWNPAGLAAEEDVNEVGTLLNAGAELYATKHVLEGVRDLTDLSHQYKDLKIKINSSLPPSAENISTLFEGLNNIAKLLGNNMGALVNANGGLGVKFKNFAVSARAIGTASLTPVVDTKNIFIKMGSSGLNLGTNTSTPTNPENALSAQTLANSIDANGLFTALNTLLGGSYANSTELANAFVNAAADLAGASEAQIAKAIGTANANMEGAAPIIELASTATGSYKDNETLVMADGATFAEAGLGYGQAVVPGLKVGGNFKVLNAYTAQNGVMVLSDDRKIKDILKDTYDNKKNSTNFGIDLGVLANFSQLTDREIFWNPQVGITIHNINNPKFDRPAPPAGADAAILRNWRTSKYELKPQVRAGAAVNPIKWLTLAADIDVTDNDTLLDGVKSRQLAFGTEINLMNRRKFNVPLRLGYNTNLATSEMASFYTAGIGLNMAHFYLELAGAFSSKSTKIEGKNIPNSSAGSLTLGFLF